MVPAHGCWKKRTGYAATFHSRTSVAARDDFAVVTLSNGKIADPCEAKLLLNHLGGREVYTVHTSLDGI